MAWYDFYKLFQYAFTKDPLSQKVDTRTLDGAGVTQPDAIPDVRQDGSYWGGGQGLIRLRDTNDFIDLSSVTNRQSRYQEYERLRNVAEIETAMTVFADESCIAGDTPISTPAYGEKTIEWLANNVKERFLVYSFDEAKGDYVLAWAFDPRKVRRAQTIKVTFDDGTDLVVTIDHRIKMREGSWATCGSLKPGDEVMPFYRRKARTDLSRGKTNQFPRIFTFKDGWKHERWFINEWKTGKNFPHYDRLGTIIRMVMGGMSVRQIAARMKHQWNSIANWLHREGFSVSELQHLAKLEDRRRVVGVQPWKEMDVYDLSVEGTKNFCTDSLVLHNCQKDDDGNVFKIEVADTEVKEELEFLFYHRNMLNLNKRMWNIAKNLYIKGDMFIELVINPDNPKEGIYKGTILPPESVFRIETTKGKLVEFQQSKEGPDYQSLTRAPVTQATEPELMQSTALRFAPEQIVHFKIGDDRKTFYPYGISLIEAARGPAHQLRLMEDAMVVYRLTRAPERRVFYIDVGQLPPYKAEAFMERMKDQFRKKKVVSNRPQQGGSSAVEERWHAPAADEDYWIPMRANSNTRVETLPGAQNLGEIDDAVYFRNKLFTALNFPKNYFSPDDPNATRITLSAQDVKFARLIERLQSHIEDGLWEIADRHLRLRGFPEESYEDLMIKMTPPSDWRELSRAEVITNRINNANGLKSSQLMPDYDILIRWLKYSEDETKEMLGRLKIQKLEELKLQVLAQNPTLLGVGVPGQNEQEVGAEPGGPSAMPAPPGGPPPGGPGGDPNAPPPPDGQDVSQLGFQPPPGNKPQPVPLAEPEEDEIKRYDLEIQDYGKEADAEDIDYSVGD